MRASCSDRRDGCSKAEELDGTSKILLPVPASSIAVLFRLLEEKERRDETALRVTMRLISPSPSSLLLVQCLMSGLTLISNRMTDWINDGRSDRTYSMRAFRQSRTSEASSSYSCCAMQPTTLSRAAADVPQVWVGSFTPKRSDVTIEPWWVSVP